MKCLLLAVALLFLPLSSSAAQYTIYTEEIPP